MDMRNIGNGVSVNAPNNPGVASFYARVGSPSPKDPNTEQYLTDRTDSFMSTIQNAGKSALSFVTGGPSAASKAVTGIATTAAANVGYEAAKIKGQVGKVYYGAVSSVETAVEGTAKTAEKVATGIKWGSMGIVLVVVVILIAQFRTAAKGA